MERMAKNMDCLFKPKRQFFTQNFWLQGPAPKNRRLIFLKRISPASSGRVQLGQFMIFPNSLAILPVSCR